MISGEIAQQMSKAVGKHTEGKSENILGQKNNMISRSTEETNTQQAKQNNESVNHSIGNIGTLRIHRESQIKILSKE